MHIHSGKRLPELDTCISKMKPGVTTFSGPVYCGGLSGQLGQSDAELFYVTVPDLKTIWNVYLKGLQVPAMTKTLVAAGIPAAAVSKYAAYHVGMLVTSPPAWKGKFLVVLYAPSSKAAANPKLGKLGRGQFIQDNKA